MADDANVVDPTQQFSLPLAWVDTDAVPIQFANQFAVQMDMGTILLTIGQAGMPYLVGTDEEKLEQAQKISFVPVTALARLSMSPARVAELRNVLDQILIAYKLNRTQVEGNF